MAGLTSPSEVGSPCKLGLAICLADHVMIRQIFQDDSGLAI